MSKIIMKSTIRFIFILTFLISFFSLIQNAKAELPPQVKTVLSPGTSSWEAYGVGTPYVFKENETYKMYYSGLSIPYQAANSRIGFAESTDGINWSNRQLVHDNGGNWNSAYSPWVIKEENTYKMYHTDYYTWVGGDWSSYISLITSTNGISWNSEQLVLKGSGNLSDFDDYQTGGQSVIKEDDGTYSMWYHIRQRPYVGRGGPARIIRATSPDGINWSNKQLVLPNIPNTLESEVTNPDVVKEPDGTYTMYYVAGGSDRDSSGSAIYRAKSTDGINWTNREQILNKDQLGTEVLGLGASNYFKDTDGKKYLYFSYSKTESLKQFIGRVSIDYLNQLKKDLTKLDPIDISLGEIYSGSFTNDGQANLFRVNVPATAPMNIALNDNASNNYNEIYAKFGSPPTRADYDYRFSQPFTANQNILVPMATAGTWYILVYGNYIASSPSNYTVKSATSGIILKSITPDRYGNTADANLTLTGSGFNSTTSVDLIGIDGTVYHASQVEADSFTQITAIFNLSSVPIGKYTVRVSQPDGDTAQIDDSFEVTSGLQATLKTNLIVPTWVGWHSKATLYIEYANTGNTSLPAPILMLTSSDNTLLTLDKSLLNQGLWASAKPEGFSDTIQILASGATPGILQPGEFLRVPVYYVGFLSEGENYNQIKYNLGVLSVDNTTEVNWSDLKDSMRPDSITAVAWEPVWANFTSQVGNTWGNYIKRLNENARYLGRLGENVNDIGKLLSFEFQQADGLSPVSNLTSSTDSAVEAPSLPLTFNRVFPKHISKRNVLGPLGYGWSPSWQISLNKDTDGTVTITGPAGTQRIFKPDSRYIGKYFSETGDYRTLNAVDGNVYTLREKNGLLYVFLANGKLNYIEDTNGNRITFGYTADFLTSLTHSSGQFLQIAYNEFGRIVSITDSLGRVTTYTYDIFNEHLLNVQYYNSKTIAYSYNTGQGITRDHSLGQITYPGNINEYFSYDEKGRLSKRNLNNNAESVSYAYDSTGKITETNALGNSSKFFFDHRGLLVKTEDALGDATSMSYDDSFNLTKITDPTGHSNNYIYDNRGNIIKSTDPIGNSTNFTYDSLFNRLTSVKDAKANLTNYSYNANGNLKSIGYANSSQEGWNYDNKGQATTWTNRRGKNINYTYDANGQIIRKIYSDDSPVDYTYNERGNLTQTTDSTGVTTYSYDSNNYLTEINYPGDKFLKFTYDSAGRRTSSLDQLNHKINYQYDAVGRLKGLTNEDGKEIVNYTYDAAGRLIRKDMGNGVYTTYEYDAAGQLLHLINYKLNNSILSRFDYTYDNRERRASMDTINGKWTYEYDDNGQLTHAVLNSTNTDIPNQDLSYTYDSLGNRIKTIENGETKVYTTNNMNQYTKFVRNSSFEFTFEYDLDGNLIREPSDTGTITYSYDDENRLIDVSNTFQYKYDALGNRFSSTINGATTRYVVDPVGFGNVVGEYDGSGNLIANYDHGFGLISRTDNSGNPAYYTFDAIGNTSEMTDNTGNIANAYSYKPFGESLKTSGNLPNTFRYVGEHGVMKESYGSYELDFMRARFYDQQTGRFISADPLSYFGSFNLYKYSENNPNNYIDPLGLKSLNDWIEDIYIGILDALGGKAGTVKAMGNYYLAAHEAKSGIEWQDDISGRNRFKQLKDYRLSIYQEPFRKSSEMIEIGKVHLPNQDSGSWDNPNWNPDDWIEGLSSKFPVLLAPIPPITITQSGGSGVVNSFDPNAKIGPSGFGSLGYIKPDSTLPYRIDFENESSATAPAQQVIITDQLDSNLDWSTFRLTEIGFGDQLIDIPANTSHFETTVPMTYNGVDFEVQIEAGIDASTGKVTAIFSSIDSESSLPPDVGIGFLPPEDGTGRGQGYFSYIVNPKSNLTTGTQIRNIALISFDGQQAIATNQIDPHDPSKGTDPTKEALNTIDSGLPTSNVVPLAATTTQTQFLVNWLGQDDTGGSGINSYDIYVSTNSGPYKLWLDDTTDTSVTFTGEFGKTYSFYSVAQDNVGYVEDSPNIEDTSTTILDKTPPETKINSGVSGIINNNSVTFTFSGIDNFTPPNLLTFAYAIDGNWSSFKNSNTAVFNNLSPGIHTFEVKAKDQASNIDQSPASAIFTFIKLHLRLSLFVKPRKIKKGKAVTISSQLKDSKGNRIANIIIIIKANNKKIKTIKTDKNGRFNFKHRPKKNTTYKAFFLGNNNYKATNSKEVKIKIKH